MYHRYVLNKQPYFVPVPVNEDGNSPPESPTDVRAREVLEEVILRRQHRLTPIPPALQTSAAQNRPINQQMSDNSLTIDDLVGARPGSTPDINQHCSYDFNVSPPSKIEVSDDKLDEDMIARLTMPGTVPPPTSSQHSTAWTISPPASHTPTVRFNIPSFARRAQVRETPSATDEQIQESSRKDAQHHAVLSAVNEEETCEQRRERRRQRREKKEARKHKHRNSSNDSTANTRQEEPAEEIRSHEYLTTKTKKSHKHHNKTTDATTSAPEEPSEEQLIQENVPTQKKKSHKHKHLNKTTDATVNALRGATEEQYIPKQVTSKKKQSHKPKHHDTSADATSKQEEPVEVVQYLDYFQDFSFKEEQSYNQQHHNTSTDATANTQEGPAKDIHYPEYLTAKKKKSRKHKHRNKTTDATVNAPEDPVKEQVISEHVTTKMKKSHKHKHSDTNAEATITMWEETAEEVHCLDYFEDFTFKEEQSCHNQQHHNASIDATANTQEEPPTDIHYPEYLTAKKKKSRKHKHRNKTTDATVNTEEPVRELHYPEYVTAKKKKSRKNKNKTKNTEPTISTFEEPAEYMQYCDTVEKIAVQQEDPTDRYQVEQEAIVPYDSFEGLEPIYLPSPITVNTNPYPITHDTSLNYDTIEQQQPPETPTINLVPLPPTPDPTNKRPTMKWRKITTPKTECGPLKPTHTSPALEEKQEVVHFEYDDITSVLDVTEEVQLTTPQRSIIDDVDREVQSYLNHQSIAAISSISNLQSTQQPESIISDDRLQRERDIDQIINKYYTKGLVDYKESKVYTQEECPESSLACIEQDITPVTNISKIGKFGRIIHMPLESHAVHATDSYDSNTIKPYPPKTPHPPATAKQHATMQPCPPPYSEKHASLKQPRPPTARPHPPTARPRPPTARPRPPTARPRPPTAKPRPPTARPHPPTARNHPASAMPQPPNAETCPQTVRHRPSTAKLQPPSAEPRPPTARPRPPTARLCRPTTARILLEPQRSVYKELGDAEWKPAESSQLPDISQAGILDSNQQLSQHPRSTSHAQEHSNNCPMPKPALGPSRLDSKKYRARLAQRNQNVVPGGRVPAHKGRHL